MVGGVQGGGDCVGVDQFRDPGRGQLVWKLCCQLGAGCVKMIVPGGGVGVNVLDEKLTLDPRPLGII